SGSLDTSKWLASNEPAPGNISGVNYGSFVPSNVDLSKGMLCLKLQQQQGNSGVMSVGGQLQSLTTYGYGTYEWVMRASSTSSTPAGAGAVVSGQISAGFNFVNNSQTEIDFEIEGQHPDTVWMTNWISTSKKQYSSVFLASPEAGFHHYKFVWVPGKIDYYIDGVLVSTHTSNLPSAPAYIMMNHWGTNSTGWGGLATLPCRVGRSQGPRARPISYFLCHCLFVDRAERLGDVENRAKPVEVAHGPPTAGGDALLLPSSRHRAVVLAIGQVMQAALCQ